MTAKPPNSSTLSPDTPIETMTTVTFTDIRDSKGDLVSEGATTFDKNLTTKGTARPNTELWIRDVLTRLDDVTSSATGNWNKQLTLSTFKRYRLSAYEKLPPQDFSSTKTFVLATETPIIDKVTGKDGPIESGATYDGDSLEFSGYAPPGMEVEALNGDTSTGKKATVNPDGLFKLTFDGLTSGAYGIKIRAVNGKESGVFDFRVILDVILILASVSDSRGVIPEDGSTYDDKVTVRGSARPGESIQLLNNGTPIKDAVASADPDDGAWEILLEVTEGDYSLAAQANYGENEITEPPRTFTVASTIKPHNTRVYDSGGLIEDNGSTPYNHVFVRGDAAPSAQIKLKINGVISPRPEPTDDTGKWVRFIQNLNYETTYQFIAVADYGDNAESNPWTITTGKQDVKPDIESVKDSRGTVVLSGSTTRDTHLTVSGKATPGQKVRLLKGTESLGEPQANGEGTWVHPITVFTEFVSLTAMALYGEGETSFPPYTFTVTPFGEITNIFDSKNTPILEGGYTTDRSLTFIGKASPNHAVEVWNGNQLMFVTTADEKGDWRRQFSLSLGLHSITIKVKGIESSPPRTLYVVENSQLVIDKVTDNNGNPIPNNGSVFRERLIHFYGSGAYQNSKLELYADNIFAGRGVADERGEFRINTGGLATGGPYRFQVRGAIEQLSQDWFITIT